MTPEELLATVLILTVTVPLAGSVFELREHVGNSAEAGMAAACTTQVRLMVWPAKAPALSKVMVCGGMVWPGLVLIGETIVTSADEGVLPLAVLLKLMSP